MTTYIAPSPKLQFFDANGNPLAGGKLYTYEAGTSTPLATYTDSTGGTPNTNPIILDSRGEASVWMSTNSYKFILNSAAGVLIWTVDNLTSAGWQSLAALAASGGSALVGYIQGLGGAVATTVQAKLREVASIKEFGTVGTADDTLVFQTAITACANRSLFIPAGNYAVSNLVIGQEINIIGEGYSLTGINQIAGSTGPVILINGARHPSMRHLKVQGAGTGTHCVSIIGASSGNQFFDCFFTGAGLDGVSVAGTADNVVLLDCILETNGRDGVSFASNTTAGSVVNCRFTSNVANGIRAEGNVLNPGIRAIGNYFSGNSVGILLKNQYFCHVSDNTVLISGSHGIHLYGGGYSTISNNISNNNTGDGINAAQATVTPDTNVISGNQCSLNANGIYLTSASYCNITGNMMKNNYAVGLGLVSSGNNNVVGNQILGNGLVTTPKYGVYLYDGGTGASSANRIVGNNINNLGNGALQTTGVYNASNAFYTIIQENNIVATTPITVAGGSVQSAKYNQTYITESSGTGAIASGTTSITLSHGLSVTPTQAAFTLMPTILSTVDPGEVYIDTITSTQFNVNCRTNPGATGWAFYWKASI